MELNVFVRERIGEIFLSLCLFHFHPLFVGDGGFFNFDLDLSSLEVSNFTGESLGKSRKNQTVDRFQEPLKKPQISRL